MLSLVTGASGHLGTNLIRTMIKEKRQIRVLLAPDTDLSAELDVEKVWGDVRDPKVMKQACEGVGTVFHLAAVISITGPKGGLVWDINVEGVRNCAKAAMNAGIKRFIHVSSIHAYNIYQNATFTVDEHCESASSKQPIYDQSKSAAEKVLREFIPRGLDVVFVNPTGIIGPYDGANSRMGRLFKDMFTRRFKVLISGGFNWVDAQDVVAGILSAEAKGRVGENYILAGYWASMADLGVVADKGAGVKGALLTVPWWLPYLSVPFFKVMGSIQNKEPLCTMESLHALKASRYMSAAKAQKELGFTARSTEASVRAIYEDYLNSGLIQQRSLSNGS